MVDLSGLLTQLQDEAKARQAEVAAAQSQLDALKSAHRDTLGQVRKAQEEHGNARRAIADARDGADKILKEADKQAGDMLNAADKAKRLADGLVNEAGKRAAKILADAQTEVEDYGRQLAGKRIELKAMNDAIATAASKLSEIKKQAKDFAGA